MKKSSKENMKSTNKVSDSCNKSNVSNRSNSKISNQSSKNIGFQDELDKTAEDSSKLR